MNPQDAAAKSKAAAQAATAELTSILRRCQPLELISRVALYIVSGTPDTPEPEKPDRNETHLEYLISLATAFPYPGGASLPSPDDVGATIELLTRIHQQASAHHLFASRDERGERGTIAEIANSFRLDRLHVRGDAFWLHLRQTMTDLLSPHDEKLYELLGFRSADYFKFFERVERSLNDRFTAEHAERALPYLSMMRPWLKAVLDPEKCSPEDKAAFEAFAEDNAKKLEVAKAAFDSFGTPALVSMSPETPEEKELLSALSCEFGDNRLFHGAKPEHAFWPLTDSLTDVKPVIQHEGIYYGFHLPKIQRGAYAIIGAMVRTADPSYWRKKLLPARDVYLEKETAALFRRALPHASVFTSMVYELPEQKTETETDVLIVCDDLLIVAECKAGSVESATHRGGTASMISDLRKTIVGAQNQAVRLVEELARRGELNLRSETDGTTVVICASDFRLVLRVSVTLDLMSSVSTSLWMLEDAGLLTETEKCWAVSLNDLRAVVDVLDQPSLFLHYLIRRLDLNVLRRVSGRDELDFLMHYVERGLFFREKNEPKEEEEVMIANFTQDLEQYYRRLEGISQFGKKPTVRVGRRMKQMLAMFESVRPRHYLSACLALLEFDIPDRELLVGKLTEHLAILRRQSAAYALSLTANSQSGDGVLLVTSRTPDAVMEVTHARAIEICRKNDLKELCVILQGVPLGKPPISIFFARPDGVASDHGLRLLRQLKREVIEFRRT